MTDIVLEHLEKVICHTDEEVRNKRTAINTYLLIKKKLTPMKPNMFSAEGRIFYMCPLCGTIIYTNNNYCSNCGQAIDWGDNDETWHRQLTNLSRLPTLSRDGRLQQEEQF